MSKAPKQVDWRDLLWRKNGVPTGPPLSNLTNVVKTLTHHEEWKGVLGFDEFLSAPSLRKAPPWNKTAASKAESWPREWTDDDTVDLVVWLQDEAGLDKIDKAHAYDGMRKVARESMFHPVRDYLNSLKWDGTDRLDTWLSIYAGAEETDFSRRVGKWWMISAVARIMNPGVQVDHVLILEGPQGLRKSGILRTLAGAWYLETDIELGSKDSLLLLKGHWIVELAELDSMSRVGAARARSFFTRLTDEFRPPYARSTIKLPRQCVFAGTVNPKEYMHDDGTGNRRYWPVTCGSIDGRALARDRDQLWAEAVYREASKEAFYPTPQEQLELFTPEQEQRASSNAQEERIRGWLFRRGPEKCAQGILLSTVLEEALSASPGDWTRMQSSIGNLMMNRIGCEKRKISIDSSGKRTYAYFLPTDFFSRPD